MLTNCADSTRRPDEPRLVEIASILATAILRLRCRESVPNSSKKPIVPITPLVMIVILSIISDERTASNGTFLSENGSNQVFWQAA